MYDSDTKAIVSYCLEKIPRLTVDDEKPLLQALEEFCRSEPKARRWMKNQPKTDIMKLVNKTKS